MTDELSQQGFQVFLKNYLGAITLLLIADCGLLDLARFNEDDGTVVALPRP